MELLKQYFILQQEIHKYFGYREDYKVIPLSDETENYWFLKFDSSFEPSGIVWSPEPFTLKSVTEGDAIYSGHIYRQRFLSKYIYGTADYTMISIDTQTDENKFLMIFDNQKQCRDSEIIQTYRRHWYCYC